MFSRFDELQSLEIDVCCFDRRNECDEFLFEIDTSTHNLKSLCLLGAHSSVLTVSCHIRDCLPACLPKLQHIGAAVRPLDAQAMLHLGTLKFAALDIIVVGPPPCLAISQSSSLETLLFKEMPRLKLEKAPIFVNTFQNYRGPWPFHHSCPRKEP